MNVLVRGAVALLGLLLVLLLGVAVLLGGGDEAQAPCGDGTGTGSAATVAGVPAGAVAGYSGDQLSNAAVIMKAGADAGLDVQGQTIGVMTAMGESGLTVVDHGDAVGPDSRGLFQQRANGAWGSYADRMDPYTSATNFFKVLKGVNGWETMPPTLAAHAVQRNADPYYYAKFWGPATQVVAALSGTDVSVLQTSTGTTSVACDPQTVGQSVAAGASGWANPLPGARLSSGFSSRANPVTGQTEHHNGQDLAEPCGTPIYAAHDGTVLKAGPASGFGYAIYIDDGPDPASGGADIVTWYGHEDPTKYPNAILVSVGDHVTAGQQIGAVGSAGQSTGCHLHVEIHVNNVPVDPVPFMSAHGAPLG